jgi:hypothetical protein
MDNTDLNKVVELSKKDKTEKWVTVSTKIKKSDAKKLELFSKYKRTTSSKLISNFVNLIIRSWDEKEREK